MEFDPAKWCGRLLCNGEITRERGGATSAIDFVLMNQTMYRLFENMYIDDGRRDFELSDHFLIRTTFLTHEIKQNA